MKIKKKISSAIISDVLDEMGYKNQVLPKKLKPNFEEAKIFGKVRIIKLKKRKKNEDEFDIHKGLFFMEKMNNGEILFVSNGFEDCAFFGELMSTFAKKRKIEGAIIQGCTRDKEETIKMKYPVFSMDNTAKDIKKRGIVEKTDLNSIEIEKIKIKRGDYIFGDLDGIVCIPKEIKKEVINKSLKVSKKEKSIKKLIEKGCDAKKIFNKEGDF